MSNFNVDDFIRAHLANELTYLLVAATSWQACRQRPRDPWPPHLIVLAQDSAFLHARNLYDFFSDPRKDGSSADLRSKIHVPHRPTPLYKSYMKALHAKLFHVSPDRPFAPGEAAGDDLQDQVVNLAQDILGLWRELLVEPKALAHHAAIERAAEAAIREARKSAVWHGIEPVFT